MDAIRSLAEFAYETHYADIPQDVINHEKLLLLDTVGVALAGANAPGIANVAKLLLGYGGIQESSLFAFSGKLPAKHAALMNAMIIQALDYDDSHDDACCHPHCSCLPAALALAERYGSSGKEILEALILGIEVECRIGAATTSSLSFTRTGTLGFFGAATAAAKIMKLPFEGLLNALGIAYAQVSTTLQSNIDGALVKRMHPGFAAQAGVFSADLAQAGISGAKNILEGPYGYYTLYEKNAYIPQKITQDLGEQWEITHVGIKNYPCARDVHAAVDASRALLKKGLNPKDIAKIEVIMPDSPFRVSGKPFSAISGHAVVEALLNGPYCVAAGILHDGLTLDDFTEKNVTDKEVAQLAEKICIQSDPNLPPKQKMPMTVTVTLNSGKKMTETCRILKGHYLNMLSPEEVQKKFHDCLSHAPFSISEDQSNALITHVNSFESIQLPLFFHDMQPMQSSL